MAEKYKFFDPVQQADGSYDREYNAQEFVEYFSKLVTTGIMKGQGSELAVSVDGSSMVSTVGVGVAFLEGHYYENNSTLSLIHDTESLGVSRIDRVVIRLDLNTEQRHVKAFIKKGVAGEAPVAPGLQRDNLVYEISLAQVTVVGGQTYIESTDVVDERGDEYACPWAGSNILPNFDDVALQNLINDVEVIEGDVTTLESQMLNYVLQYIDRNSIFYVDAVNGDDYENMGTIESSPFKTIQRAVDAMKNLHNFSIQVYVAAGTYDGFTVSYHYGGEISFRGTSDGSGNPGPTILNDSIHIINSDSRINLSFFDIRPNPYGTGIDFEHYWGDASVSSIRITTRNSTWGGGDSEKHTGLRAKGACVVSMEYVTISNASRAIVAETGAQVIPYNTNGDNNNTVCSATSGVIRGMPSLLTGTTLKDIFGGGEIID
jgi:hypothetical protein